MVADPEQRECKVCKFVSAPLDWTGPDNLNNQETVTLYQCHQTGPVSRETLKVFQTVTNVVNSVVVNHTHIVKGQPQRKA